MPNQQRKSIPLLAPKEALLTMEVELVESFRRILRSGEYILGNEGRALEQEVATYLGVNEAIAVANGTDALVLALEAMGIGPGDEVITTPFTFFATVEAIVRVGARPRFVDVDPDTYNLDPKQVKAQISAQTKAILPVHLFGLPAPMGELNAIAQHHGLVVIEDACQAIGAMYQGRMVGGWGDVGCFSFFPTKNLGTMGDGGMVVTNQQEVAARIRQLRNHGSEQKYYHTAIGYNSRLDEIHAAILRHLLPQLAGWNQRRYQLACGYYEQLSQLEALRILTPQAGHVYHLFCVEVEERAALQHALEQEGIRTGIYYPYPLHRLPALKPFQLQGEEFPVAERLATQLLALPLHPFLTEEEQERVIATIYQFMTKKEG